MFVPVSLGALQSDWSFVHQADKYSLWADAQVGHRQGVCVAALLASRVLSCPVSAGYLLTPPPFLPAYSQAAPQRATPTRLYRSCGRCGGSAWWRSTPVAPPASTPPTTLRWGGCPRRGGYASSQHLPAQCWPHVLTPLPLFCAPHCAQHNPDLASRAGSPQLLWEHFMLVGQFQGRQHT